ncbi:hypothetical protein [Streptomyces viridochromogenes]|uniref:hypothetical protein n=1 Tax=Streptomyces viridochromogenes TaxID=1938 RepID=UPI00065C9BE0|nr:hypothetical protein [Streptomyces viridochromogenes]
MEGGHGRTAIASWPASVRTAGTSSTPLALSIRTAFSTSLCRSTWWRTSTPEELWDLRLSAYGGPEIRLAMVTGDLADRQDVRVFPVVRSVGPGGGLSLRPQLTRDHDLALRTADGRGGAAEA